MIRSIIYFKLKLIKNFLKYLTDKCFLLFWVGVIISVGMILFRTLFTDFTVMGYSRWLKSILSFTMLFFDINNFLNSFLYNFDFRFKISFNFFIISLYIWNIWKIKTKFFYAILLLFLIILLIVASRACIYWFSNRY